MVAVFAMTALMSIAANWTADTPATKRQREWFVHVRARDPEAPESRKLARHVPRDVLACRWMR
ncbi:hypothetical protein RL1937 [Rhizobium johnstonii 3841]|uniref:Transmembrane protein n=1 Tax=Rhizobium johnstonii (strain DSM 114642 / LMG 32736 / 3841) TaxID=216596 RepID=Q1MHY0_RHIJ3|nr:hypothetical protein [Rhizobium leguminosarum]CAK07430.1 hypothetical protein RL1937 [Rhizobium johnstonii 3841]